MQSLLQPSAVSATKTYLLGNSKTFNANNTTAYVPVFRITGSVLIKKLYGVVTTVLGSAHTVAYFRLNDQTAQLNITLNTGTTLSSAPAGSLIMKTGLAAAAVTLKSNAAGAILEPTTLETVIPSEFVITKKTGANTDIEYSYATTNTPTTGVMQFFVEWQPLSADGGITAV